jgi:DNA mismatch repair protein MutS
MSGADIDDMRQRLSIAVSALDSWYFGDDLAKETLTGHFKVHTLTALGLSDYDCGTIAAGALLKYLYETQKNSLEHIVEIHPYSIGKFMIIDSSTRRNLELVETLREKQKRGSLLWVLDKTRTAMGARYLRSCVEQPLIDKAEILKRQQIIENFNQNAITREELREYLNPIYDLERLITRISYQTANPRDLLAFRNSLEMLPPIRTLLSDLNGALVEEIKGDFDCLDDLYELLVASINEDAPISVREGDLIKEGYNEEVDRLRSAKTQGKSWLAKLEADEREKTGIKNLRIKYNKVFGYYLEVTNSFKEQVPDYFVRKQTLTNAERYITPELKELEDTILGAEDRLTSLEYELFRQARADRLKCAADLKDSESGGKAGCVCVACRRCGAEQLLQAEDQRKRHYRDQERSPSGRGKNDHERSFHRQ